MADKPVLQQYDYTLGPVGRSILLEIRKFPQRGYPSVSRLANHGIDNSESTIIEVDLADMTSRDYRLYLVNSLDSLPNLAQLRGTIQYARAEQNPFVTAGDQKRTDQHHVLAGQYTTGYGYHSNSIQMLVTNGGDTEQYGEIPYRSIQRFDDYVAKIKAPLGYAKCFSFRFVLDAPLSGNHDAPRMWQMPISGTPLKTNEWMDSVQVMLMQNLYGKRVTLNFRFVTARGSDGCNAPQLFDIVSVTPGPFKFENFGRVQVQEVEIKLRELQGPVWTK